MKLIELLKEMLTKPISELNIIQLTVVVLIMIAALFLLKKLFVLIGKILVYIGRALKIIFSAKERCKKLQCTSCGRTLDKCVCQKNSGKSYIKRLYLYRKEEKEKR